MANINHLILNFKYNSMPKSMVFINYKQTSISFFIILSESGIVHPHSSKRDYKCEEDESDQTEIGRVAIKSFSSMIPVSPCLKL
jgi:hypothetical protein